MSSSSNRRYEPTSPYSGTQALQDGRHTHGRRTGQRFNLDYQLARLQDHVQDLAHQLRRAVRKGRPEKQIVIAEMLHRTKATAGQLAVTIAERNNGPVVPMHEGRRVLLDLTPQMWQSWGPKRKPFNREILNHGKVFILPDDDVA